MKLAYLSQYLKMILKRYYRGLSADFAMLRKLLAGRKSPFHIQYSTDSRRAVQGNLEPWSGQVVRFSYLRGH